MQDLLWPIKAFEHGIEVDIIHITHTYILYLNAILKSNSYPVAREGLWEGEKNKNSLQHWVFPGSHPSKY